MPDRFRRSIYIYIYIFEKILFGSLDACISMTGVINHSVGCELISFTKWCGTENSYLEYCFFVEMDPQFTCK